MLSFKMNMPFYLMVFYGSIMIAAVLVLRGLLRNKVPKFVFPILWSAVLLRLLVPFSLSSPLSLSVPEFLMTPSHETSYADAVVEDKDIPAAQSSAPTTATEGTAEIAVAFESETTNNAIMIDYQAQTAISNTADFRVLIYLYALGGLGTAGILLFQKYRYTKCLKASLLLEHNETINTLLREMDMGHILVFTNDVIASPLVCGLLAPRIYLPARMDFGNTELLRHNICHETMHIRRRDNWIKCIMLITLCIHWFNPLVWIMSRYLAADLETACDEAVLRLYDRGDNAEETKKSYAFSLLAMAISGSRPTLLYSAFSKTEVEKRIQSILNYRKASFLLLAIAVCFMTCSTVAFATCAQAPFSPYLTSSCASDFCRFGVKVYTTRDLTLGQDAQMRAENIIFDVLDKNTDNDPAHMNKEILTALSAEFHVEESAFRTDFFLCLSDEEKETEYTAWDLSMEQDGIRYYKGEQVRVLVDEMGGTFYSHSDGTVDITVVRDRFGFIADMKVRHEDERNQSALQ